jgi:hypothetical protein
MPIAVLQHSRRLLAPLAIAFALAATLTSAAQADVAPKLLRPSAGATLTASSPPTFKVRDRGHAFHGNVWIEVSASKRRDRHGDLKTSPIGTFAQMKRRRHGVYTWVPPMFTFPEWFMVRPGTYYWEAFHVNCDVAGCRVRSKIRSFVVR